MNDRGLWRLDPDRRGLAPPLSLPALGVEISAAGEFAYVKRASAERQAAMWNQVLADDPVFGPPSGYQVGYGRTDDAHRRWVLVWEPNEGGDGT